MPRLRYIIMMSKRMGASVLDVEQFAREWVAAWNSRDLEAILSHYHEDVTFSSPLIRSLDVSESGTVRGKSALREYFRGALARNPQLRFDLVAAFASTGSVAVLYDSHGGWRAVETMALSDGRVERSWAHYPPDVLVTAGSSGR